MTEITHETDETIWRALTDQNAEGELLYKAKIAGIEAPDLPDLAAQIVEDPSLQTGLTPLNQPVTPDQPKR